MKSMTQNLFLATAAVLFIATFCIEAKPTITNLEGGNFGPFETRNSADDDEEVQSYGGGRFENQPFALTAPPTADSSRPDLSQMNVLIRFLVDEVRNRRLNGDRLESGRSFAIPMRPISYGKRQIVYRQCFFNPISCF